MRIEIDYERSKCKRKIVLVVRFFSLPLLLVLALRYIGHSIRSIGQVVPGKVYVSKI